MGESTGSPGSGPVATVDCNDAGTPAPSLAELPTDAREWKPLCGYIYRWRSDHGRTSDGRWPVTATVTWTAAWTSNTGASGTVSTTRQGATSISVLENRTRLVDDPRATVQPGG